MIVAIFAILLLNHGTIFSEEPSYEEPLCPRSRYCRRRCRCRNLDFVEQGKMAIETRKIVVRKKDNLWNIVKQHGFPPRDWKKIYDANYNSKLKKLRTDPNLIFPGDEIFLPKSTPSDLKGKLERLKITTKLISELAVLNKPLKGEIKKLQALRKSAKNFDDKLIRHLEKYIKELSDLNDSIKSDMDTADAFEMAGMVKAIQRNRGLIEKAKKSIEAIAKSKGRLDSAFDKEVKTLGKIHSELERGISILVSETARITSQYVSLLRKPY